MKVFKKIFKWFGLSIGFLLLLIVVASIGSRFFSPKPQAPGTLIDVGGYKLHINSTGEKNNKPTLLIESGAGAPGEYYHWLSEGLKDSIRVVRYDRAGIGYSELSNTSSNPEAAVRDFHKLLDLAGESPPYILAGHSYGGHYIRIFSKLYPDEVAAMVFLDPSHPDAGKRLKMPKEPWFLSPMYKIGTVLGDLGVLHLFDRNFGPILWAPGLPEKILNRMKDYMYNGKYLKGFLRQDGDDTWAQSLKEGASEAKDFGSIPVKVFSGTQQRDTVLLKRGIDPEHWRTTRAQMHQEIADLSSEGELFFVDSGHITMFTEKENADFICKEIIDLIPTE